MAAKRGREFGYEMANEHRLKIANSNILRYLIDHAQGIRKMEQTQVTAGIALLRKVLPDLAVVELNGGSTPITLRTIITGVPRLTDITDIEPIEPQQIEAPKSDKP